MPLQWTTTPQDLAEILHCHFYQQHDRMPGQGHDGSPKELSAIIFHASLFSDLMNKDHDKDIRRELNRMQEEGLDYDEQASKAMHLIEAALVSSGKLKARSCLFYDPERIDKLLEREDLEDFDFLQEEPPS